MARQAWDTERERKEDITELVNQLNADCFKGTCRGNWRTFGAAREVSVHLLYIQFSGSQSLNLSWQLSMR